MRDPLQYYKNVTVNTVNVLDCMAAAGIKQVGWGGVGTPARGTPARGATACGATARGATGRL